MFEKKEAKKRLYFVLLSIISGYESSVIGKLKSMKTIKDGCIILGRWDVIIKIVITEDVQSVFGHFNSMEGISAVKVLEGK